MPRRSPGREEEEAQPAGCRRGRRAGEARVKAEHNEPRQRGAGERRPVPVRRASGGSEALRRFAPLHVDVAAHFGAQRSTADIRRTENGKGTGLAAQQAREEAAQQAREEAARREREEAAARLEREETARRAREEAERQAQEAARAEAEQRVKEEEQRAKDEKARLAKETADRARAEADRKAREEALAQQNWIAASLALAQQG